MGTDLGRMVAVSATTTVVVLLLTKLPWLWGEVIVPKFRFWQALQTITRWYRWSLDLYENYGWSTYDITVVGMSLIRKSEEEIIELDRTRRMDEETAILLREQELNLLQAGFPCIPPSVREEFLQAIKQKVHLKCARERLPSLLPEAFVEIVKETHDELHAKADSRLLAHITLDNFPEYLKSVLQEMGVSEEDVITVYHVHKTDKDT